MKARGATPEESIAALKAEELRLAVERDAAQSALQQAQTALTSDGENGIKARQRASLEAEARGREHVPMATIAKDAADAQAAVAANGVKVEALEGAIREIAKDIERIRDENIAHFAADAHASSLAAVEAQEEALRAINAAIVACREAQGKWSQVRFSRGRMGWSSLPEMPLVDSDGMTSGFTGATRPPWPGGRQRTDAESRAAGLPGEWPPQSVRGS